MLNIETSNAVLDMRYIRTHPGAKAGSYVMLRVSDTGSGMDRETVERIFEPFYSTRKEGARAGLGLATVYGIVKQHGGYIWAESAPAKGTVFSLFFPRIRRSEHQGQLASPQGLKKPGKETILVVEDEFSVRRLATIILQKNGYRVLEAEDPEEAVRIAVADRAHIDLLLTDVIMPEMNGRELYKRIAACRPHIKVLFMSGYTDDVIAHHGVLDEGLHFLQKPFSVQALTDKVDDVLATMAHA